MNTQDDALREAFIYAIEHTQWKQEHLELSNGTKLIICHNMPETQGLSIEDAMHSWLARTRDYTAQSLVDYIMSKYHMHGNFAMTKETWDEINA